ncbi:ATP-grasp domain-containing protein [Streptomyces sp. NRRL B-3648]|uniref:ATP-grasp domain-containing protein n=1 Tax=Streptomyces sp. NRRL B-3648 TaxID=1519493 RepID=UPI0006ADCCD2|nr:ATP-grasp domain-containing protein [Streptomyces sp. NRRL B-3648]KOX05186.1 phosphoribosylglycinamide synthetase [Streptomyces sp. NRRL B-3648]
MTQVQPATGQRPLLLVVATGMRTYREYLLRSIRSEFDIHLFHVDEPTWEKEYISGWTVLPSTLNGPAMADAARRLHADTPVAGVLCWDEGRIHAASYVAEALGLRNGEPDVIWRLRDKGQTRAALDAAGVAQPRSLPVKTLDEALAAAGRIGYPVILKPRGLGASLGVVRIDGAAELAEKFAFTAGMKGPDPEPLLYSTDQPVLVEELVTGAEISVDAVVQDGKVTPLFIGRKVVGYPPYAEETGHFVDGDDPLLTDPQLLDALQDTHTALGFRDGWTHSEFMLTAAGPRLIEVNGRLGGDMIPYLGMLATGIDPGLAAARAACGITPDAAPSRRRVAGIRFFYVEHDDTRIESVTFRETGLPAGVEELVAVAGPGAVVSPPPKGTVWGRIAFAIATGDSVEECGAVLDAAESALDVRSDHNAPMREMS